MESFPDAGFFLRTDQKIQESVLLCNGRTEMGFRIGMGPWYLSGFE